MVKVSCVIGFLVVLLCFSFGSVIADRLPNQTPENQIFSIDTVLEVTGAVDDANSLKWVIASPGAIPTGIIGSAQSIADVTYKDSILTNGGKVSENKNFGFDSQDKAKGLYNHETEKVLTYAGTEGAHLVGGEEYTLDVAGNWANVYDNIRCVFSSGPGIGVPAFCNIVSAKSNLININSAQISTKGNLRSVTDSVLVPTEMNYRIAVSPDANSGSGFAEGTVSTVFAGSIMEARDAGNSTWNKTAAEVTWKDSTTVTGGIKNFQKVFGDPSFQSGILDPQDAPELGPTTGTVIVNHEVAPDSISTPDGGGIGFTLTGPGILNSGTTPATFSNMPPGEYTATRVVGGTSAQLWAPSATGTLTAGGTLILTLSQPL